jgi:hypothetical protein
MIPNSGLPVNYPNPQILHLKYSNPQILPTGPWFTNEIKGMNRGCVSQTNFQGKESLKSATEIVQAFDAILPTDTKAACLNLSGKKGTYTRYPQPNFNLSCRLFLARERHAIVAFFKPSVFSRHAIHAHDPSKYNKNVNFRFLQLDGKYPFILDLNGNFCQKDVSGRNAVLHED